MTLDEPFRRAATAPDARRLTSLLRRLADLWWYGVRVHVAEVHGLPRPPDPPRPDQVWPFGHM